MDRDKIQQTLRAHLEAELTLGGRWLPRAEGKQARAAAAQAYAEGLQEKAARTTRSTPPGDTQMAKSRSSRTKEEKQAALDEIACRLQKCRQCELGASRLNCVPGAGNPNARIVFVGEAPGQSEDEQGLPFVGRAGVLLTKIIEAMGLTREDVFICNILKCRPPENRNPLLPEVAACSSFLHEQLQIIEPDIIVALGSYAAKTLLDTSISIGQLRGKIHEYVPGPMAEPIALIATYHPAYLLRNYTPESRRQVWQDMQRVLQYLHLPVPDGKK